jgi:hypothetical protein
MDAELGGRTRQIGVVGFVRYAHYSDPLIVPPFDSDGPRYRARVDDVYAGARVHYWPIRWLRLGGGLGLIEHREADRALAPPAAGAPSHMATSWSNGGYVGVQAALAALQLDRYQLELGVDLGTAADSGLSAAIGIDVRM